MTIGGSDAAHGAEYAENISVPVRVLRGADALAALDARWDAAASADGAPVFRRASFLRAAATCEAIDRVVVTMAERGQQLVVGAAWLVNGNEVSGLGRGPGDYLGPVCDPHVEARVRSVAMASTVRAVVASTGARALRLHALPDATGIAATLEAVPGLHVTTLRRTIAPTMDMSRADVAARKKSLRRHENGLRRSGELVFQGFADVADIDDRIDDLIDMHQRRWATTPTPSEFNDPATRMRFRAMACALAADGVARLHELRVGGELVAAHLGFVDRDRFLWYKPAFEPRWARSSPGEVLLRQLILAARDEGVREFDFTVGDEPFKLRFATRLRGVVDLHATFSAVEASRTRAWVAARDTARGVLQPRGLWEPLRAIARR